MTDTQPITTSWHSYPKVYALGHREVAGLLGQEVRVEEKVDGSQFSFGVFNGDIRMRSKGAQLIPDAPERMFALAAETVKRLAPVLRDGWTYRGEYLQKPKHNALAYDRVPAGNIILFDVNPGHEEYLPHAAVVVEGARIGLEVVPLIHQGVIGDIAEFRRFLETKSVLGGQQVEGVVVKPVLPQYGEDKKLLLGKFVSEAFKEVHGAEWKEANPNKGDVVMLLAEKYRTPARWMKAAQHLRDDGKLLDAPQDIGNLMKEVQADLLLEEEAAIKEQLWKWASPIILRKAVAGLPQWYKEELLKKQFEPAAETAAEAAKRVEDTGDTYHEDVQVPA